MAQAVLVSDRVQDILHAKYIVQDLEYYENASYYNSLDRAQAEAPYRPVCAHRQRAGPAGGAGAASLWRAWPCCFLPYWLLVAALLLAALPAVFVRLRYSLKLYSRQRSVI